jgi:hypothetical protein
MEIRVSDPKGRLMAYQKARRGTARTGNWVRPGLKFFLVDRQTSAVVAEAQAGDYACADSQAAEDAAATVAMPAR